MTDSLFKVYKKFYQRSYRNPEDLELKLISDTVYEVIKDLHKSLNDPEQHEAIKSNAKIVFKEISRREKAMAPSILFSSALISALNRKRIDLEIPYPVVQRWNSEDRIGLIYILTSESRRGLCKLGATTMPMNKRIYFYELKYGYPVTEYYSKEVTSPLQLELLVANKMKLHRVSGNTIGESNEWYSCDPKLMKAQIISELRDKSP